MREAVAAKVWKIAVCERNIMLPWLACMDQNFVENMPQRRASAFLAALPGGPCTRENAFASRANHYDLARRDGGLLGRRAILFYSTTVGKSWRRVASEIIKIFTENPRLLKIPPFRSGRASY